MHRQTISNRLQPGKLIGATMIDRAQPLPVVTRHAVKLALNDRTAI